MAGDLGDAYRSILKASCAPIYWYRVDRQDLSILRNGTVTFVRTPERVLGVTAAHVLRAYLADAESGAVRSQIVNSVVDDLRTRIIDIEEKLDITTFAVDDALLHDTNKAIVLIANWPPRPPQEGRGIMLSGYPTVVRNVESNQVSFGLFTSLVIARTVTDVQITWVIEPEESVANARIPTPPPQHGLGGISGGPLIGWFDSDNHVATYG